MAPALSRSVCNKVQQEITSICVTSSRPPILTIVCPGRIWDPYAIPPTAIFGKVVEKVQDRFWNLMAMWSQIPMCLPNLLTQPFSQIPHRNLLNLNLHAWLLEPRLSRSKVSLRQWQHELRPHIVSTRSVYEAKWTIFTKLCHYNQVDFRAPPINSLPGQEVAAKYS